MTLRGGVEMVIYFQSSGELHAGESLRPWPKITTRRTTSSKQLRGIFDKVGPEKYPLGSSEAEVGHSSIQDFPSL